MSIDTLRPPTETKAKKECRCNFCGDKIIVGDIYLKSTHKFDGSIYDWKTHKCCAKLAERINLFQHAEDGVSQEDFMESVHGEYISIMVEFFPKNEINKYADVIQQLRFVKFRDKLWYVIRHYNKIDKQQ